MPTSQVIRDSKHHFQGQDHQAALLNAVLARKAVVAMGVGTCWPWEPTATLRLLGGARGGGAPGGGGVGAYRVARRCSA